MMPVRELFAWITSAPDAARGARERQPAGRELREADRRLERVQAQARVHGRQGQPVDAGAVDGVGQRARRAGRRRRRS